MWRGSSGSKAGLAGRVPRQGAMLFSWPVRAGIIVVVRLGGIYRLARSRPRWQAESVSSMLTGSRGMPQEYIIRYGRMRALGEFRSLPDFDHARGEQVVIRTERGIELGE